MKRKNKIRDFVFEWLEREEAFIFWMVVLNITASLVTYGAFLDGVYSFIREFMILACDVAISFLTVSVIDIILYLALRKFKMLHNAAKFIFVAVNAVMFCSDIFAIYYYKQPLNSMMFEFIMMTNARESSEFLKMYLSDPKLWCFAITVIMSMMLLRFLWIKTVNKTKILRFCAFVFCLTLGIFALGRQFYLYNGFGFVRAVNSIGVLRLTDMFYSNLTSLKDYDKMLKELPKKVSITKDESTIPYIVFVLGESTNRKHMSLYGYTLDTNPLLSARVSNKNNLGGTLYVFDDVISPHSRTEASMQKLFNFCNYESKNKWFTYQNIINILKTANYYTIWLSNQESSALSGISPSAIFSRLCDSSKFTDMFNDKPVIRNVRDDALLPFLDEELSKASAKSLFSIFEVVYA